MPPTNEQRTVEEWLRGDPDYFLTSMRVFRDETADSELEAGWYGFWNLVSIWTTLQLKVRGKQYVEIKPQADLIDFEDPESESSLSGDGNIDNNSNAGADARGHSDVLYHGVRDTDAKNVSDGDDYNADVDDDEPNDTENSDVESLEERTRAIDLDSLPDEIAAVDADSAEFTYSSGSRSNSDDLEMVEDDRTCFPDWALIFYELPKPLPQTHRLYNALFPCLPPEHRPYRRMLLLIEVKRVAPARVKNGTMRKPYDKEQYLMHINNILEGWELSEQIYQQVRATFANFPKQNKVLHLSAVGDYCKLRWFERDVWMANGLMPRTKENDYLIPTWEQMTCMPPFISPPPPPQLHCIMSMDPNTQGINREIMAEIERSQRELEQSIEDEHRELMGTNLF